MSTSAKTQRFFDGHAGDYYRHNYEEPETRHAYNLALRRQACLALLPLPTTTELVLDLGCGPGAMLVPLLESGHRVVATDLSPAMAGEALGRARSLGAESCVAVADATSLPFADRAFAAVVTTGVLEYIPDLRVAMMEISRVLRPGGVLIGTMSLPRRLERITTRAFAMMRGPVAQISQFIYSRTAFDRVVESAGLRIDVRQCCAFVPFPLDVLWPKSVPWVDRTFGSSLNRIDAACDHAKTYIVRATRP